VEYADAISMENELAVLGSIEQASLDALKSYATTEEDDAKLINDQRMFNMLDKTKRMAIKHRRSEKRLLKKTAAAVRQQIINLKSGRRPLRPMDD
jgi:histone-lysine N-methyltransferase SETD3